jgi:hypothetical protein
MTATAYKFLTRDATGPLSGFAWPLPEGSAPGPWVDVGAGALELCVRGAHVCRLADLAYWLNDELWQVEVGGEQIEGIDCLVVRQARLVRRLDSWRDGGVAARFAEACVAHGVGLVPTGAPARPYLDDAAEAARYGYVAVAAFAAALAVARTSGDADGGDQAYRLERSWQSAWISRELAL